MQEVRLLVEETERSLSFTPLVLGLNHVLSKRDWWNYCCILCEAYVQGLWDLSLWGSLCSHSLLFTEIQVLTTLHLLCFFFFLSSTQAQVFQSLVCTVQVTVEVSIPYGLGIFHFCPWLIWGLWRGRGKMVASKWKLTDVSFIKSYIIYHLTTHTSENDTERRQSND